MDRNYMNTHLAVDRYLRGTLAEDELAEFEERLLWDEELRDEVDLAERLQEGLQASLQRAGARTRRKGLTDWLASLLYAPQYAAAASFLLAAVLTAGIFMSPLIQVDDQPGGNAMPTEIIPLITTRAPDDVPLILVDQDAWIVLLVDAPPTYESFRVSVRAHGSTEPFWMQDGLEATYPDALAIGMPGRALVVGEYVLILEGIHASNSEKRSYEHIQDIHFRAESLD